MNVLIESKVVTPEDVKIYRSSKYQVITIIPSTEAPTMNVYVFNQEELERFLKTYSRYSEFVIAVSQVQALA